MNTKLTGPWRVTHTADDRTLIDDDEDAFSIAEVSRLRPAYEEHAQLIAAAPELLKAAKWALEELAKLGKASTVSCECDLDEAIAKAEGRP